MLVGSHPNALLILGDIAAVFAAGRDEDSWIWNLDSTVNEQSLILPFNILRKNIFLWKDWSAVTPLDYLDPFLEVIKSPETSGKLTSASLLAVKHFLENNLLGDSVHGVAIAVQAISESVTQCKFESSYPAFDECVLNEILDVLVTLVKCPQGFFLTHDNLIDIFQACYRIGHIRTDRGRQTSEMLTHASRRAMSALVRTLFSRIDDLNAAGPGSSPLVQGTPISRLVVSQSEEALSSADDDVTGTADNEQLEMKEGKPDEVAEGVTTIGSETAAEMEKSHHDIVSLLPPITVEGTTENGAVSKEENRQPLDCSMYGIQALVEVLRFVISMIHSKPPKHHPELPSYGIELVSSSIQAAGPAIGEHIQLLNLLRQDLTMSMFAAAEHATFRCLAGICQLSVTLYSLFREQMMPQVEVILDLLLIPIAEGTLATSFAQRQIAMEGVVDFCRQPGFLSTIYVNMDCRVQSSDLFAKICGVLSKAGFPTAEGSVSTFHSLSLEGMKTILESLKPPLNFREYNAELDEDSSEGFILDTSEYFDIWSSLCDGEMFVLPGIQPGNPAEVIRAEKKLKAELTSVVEHFNRDQKKGFEYCQSLKLLPSPLTASSVAKFLRSCPGLSKAAIGEVLGERGGFYEEIRSEFIETFDFTGLRFDLALRLFMDAFRPPGEGQKIDRIMQCFGKRYFEQNATGGLKSSDAAYVLAFSVIMLNTDLHNTQNKKKMTLEDFARINRNTNEGDPMPKELLTEIYAAISTNEFKISAESTPFELSHQLVFWSNLAERAGTARGRPLPRLLEVGAMSVMRKNMFKLTWGPTLAAISVILDGSSSSRRVKVATETLSLAAELSSIFHVEGVVDQILASIVKYTVPLDSESMKPAIAYGGSLKAKDSVETIFMIADAYGDVIRSGWKYVISCIVKVYLAGLLPPAIILADGESLEEASLRMPHLVPRYKGSSGSIFSRAINSLISIETDNSEDGYMNSEERSALDSAKFSIEKCGVERVVHDSKFLVADSLVELVKATVWSGSNSLAASKAGEPTDTAELALEMLISLSLRNRDRIASIWPFVHDFLAACTSHEAAEKTNPLVERSMKGLMRICQRLLPYKDDTTDMLLGSLSLIGEMHPAVVWELSPSIASELIVLISQSAPFIKTENGWRTIAILIRMSASRSEVLPYSIKALSLACRNPGSVTSVSYMPLLETSLQLIDTFKTSSPEVASRFLDCADALFSWLPTQKLSSSNGSPKVIDAETLLDLWLTSVGILARGLCREPSPALRNTSLASLHRTLISSESLQLPADIWVQTMRELLLPLVSDLAKIASSSQSRNFPDVDKTLRMSVNMLTKVLLQYIPLMQNDRDFGLVWEKSFKVLKVCMENNHEELVESVPENTKNMLLVLSHQGILIPDWSDGGGKSLWTITWENAIQISKDLIPEFLSASKPTEIPLQAVRSGAGPQNTETNSDLCPAEDNNLTTKKSVHIEEESKQGGDDEKKGSEATNEPTEEVNEELEPPTCKQS